METALEAVVADLTRRSVPGVAAIVVRGEAADEVAVAGTADLATGGRMTADTVHLWFSMTKIVTATAAMQLAEDQALSLDDPVRGYVPDFPEPRSGWPQVRVRHLLSHSAGLANPLPVRWVHAAGEPGRDPHEFAVELLARHSRLRSRAGERAAYSNLGYIVLGEVIAAAAGTGYEEFVRERILDPLGMSRTAFDYAGFTDDIATGYQPRLSPMTPLFRLILPSGIIGRRAGRFMAFNRFLVDGPAYGGLVGSPRDAARFMRAHLNGGEAGGVRLLTPESVAAMQTIQARGRGLDVGYGWFRRGARRANASHLEHLGGGGGFWNMMRIHPGLGVGVLSMGNATRYDHESLARSGLTELPSER